MRIHVSGRIGKCKRLIHCDLMSSKFVGSSLVRCLRTYVYPSPERQRGRFEDVYFVPAEKQNITNISVEILTLEGEWVKFEDSETPSRLVLHFRKVPPTWQRTRDINTSRHYPQHTFYYHGSPRAVLPTSGVSRHRRQRWYGADLFRAVDLLAALRDRQFSQRPLADGQTHPVKRCQGRRPRDIANGREVL